MSSGPSQEEPPPWRQRSDTSEPLTRILCGPQKIRNPSRNRANPRAAAEEGSFVCNGFGVLPLPYMGLGHMGLGPAGDSCQGEGRQATFRPHPTVKRRQLADNDGNRNGPSSCGNTHNRRSEAPPAPPSQGGDHGFVTPSGVPSVAAGQRPVSLSGRASGRPRGRCRLA